MTSQFKNEYDKRYESMINSDFGMYTNDGYNFRVMNFDNSHEYHVSIQMKKHKAHCDCADFMQRCDSMGIPCKHIMYVTEYKDEYMNSRRRICEEILRRFRISQVGAI